jgi:hypothetical protein
MMFSDAIVQYTRGSPYVDYGNKPGLHGLQKVQSHTREKPKARRVALIGVLAFARTGKDIRRSTG